MLAFPKILNFCCFSAESEKKVTSNEGVKRKAFIIKLSKILVFIIFSLTTPKCFTVDFGLFWVYLSLPNVLFTCSK